MKKRILALVLTVLMVVGAVPMAVFAADSEGPVENYTGTAYDSALTAEDFEADYDALVKAAYKSDATYWTKQAIQGVNVEKDKVYTNGTFYRKSIIPGATTSPDVEADYKAVWEKGYAGLDMVVSFEVQATTSSGTTNLQIRTQPGKGNGVWGQNILKFYKAGTVYQLYIINPDDANGKLIGEIPVKSDESDEFLKVDVLFDSGAVSGNAFERTVYYVYVNGVYAASGLFSQASVHQAQYTYQKEWAASAEAEMPYGMMYGALAFQEGASGGAYNMRNVSVYFYDDNGDGNPTDSTRVKNVSADILSLKHYQDFNALTDGEYKASTPSLLGGNVNATINIGSTVVNDGRGGKALIQNGTGDAYYAVQPGAASGTNFVTSFDLKLNGTPGNVCLVNGCAYNANAGEYGRDFNLGMVYLRTDGGVYLARKSDDTSSGVLINHYTDVTPYLTDKLCDVTTDHFVNIAVAINAKANTYRVYINGVDATGELQLLTDSDLALLKATSTFPNGFGLTHRRFTLQGNIIVDNVAVYYADDIVNKNTTPLNGIVKEGEKFYYYENGVAVPNSYAGDTPYYTDKNGALIEDAYVTIGGKRYDFDNYVGVVVEGVKGTDNGVVLYIDGVVVKNGAYEFNGNTYLADANGNLLTGLQVIDGEDWIFDASTYVGTKLEVEEGDSIIVDKETGEVYDDIQDMVDNATEGAEVKVYGDIVSEEAIAIGNQVKLDLNGNTITAPQVTIFAGTEIVNSADNKGVINVEKGKLSVVRVTDNMTAFYEEGVGYKFAEVKKQDNMPEETKTNDGFVFIFRPSLDGNAALNSALFADGAEDNDMMFVVKLVKEDGTVIRSFKYAESLIEDAYTNNLAFKITVRGLDPVEHGTINVVYGIESGTGLMCEIVAATFTPTAAEPAPAE